MSKRQRKILYGAALALFLAAAALVCIPTSTQSRYLIAADWQEEYSQTPAFTSNTLCAGGKNWRLQTRAVTENTAVPLPMTFTDTAGQKTLQLTAASDSSAVTVQSGTGQVSLADSGEATHTLTLCLHPVTAQTTANIAVTATCGGETLSGTFRITLEPAGTQTVYTGTEEDDIFVESETMDTYLAQKPLCISYALASDGTLSFSDGSIYTDGKFPELTAYRLASTGETWTLFEADTLPLEGGSDLLILDFSQVTAVTQELPQLQLQIHSAEGTVDTQAIASEEITDSGISLSATGVPTVYVPALNKCTVQAEVSMLQWQADQTAASGKSLSYVAMGDAVTLRWGDADSTGGRTLTLAAASGSLPAGTYRLTLTWTLAGTTVAQQTVPFYVHYEG